MPASIPVGELRKARLSFIVDGVNLVANRCIHKEQSAVAGRGRLHRCLSSRRVRARGLQHRCPFICRPGRPTLHLHRCLSSRRVRARGLQHRCPFICRPGRPTLHLHRCLSSRRVRARGLQHRCPFICGPSSHTSSFGRLCSISPSPNHAASMRFGPGGPWRTLSLRDPSIRPGRTSLPLRPPRQRSMKWAMMSDSNSVQTPERGLIPRLRDGYSAPVAAVVRRR